MSHVFIIGEIGINHNGDINLAKKLIDGAAGQGWVRYGKISKTDN